MMQDSPATVQSHIMFPQAFRAFDVGTHLTTVKGYGGFVGGVPRPRSLTIRTAASNNSRTRSFQIREASRVVRRGVLQAFEREGHCRTHAPPSWSLLQRMKFVSDKTLRLPQVN